MISVFAVKGFWIKTCLRELIGDSIGGLSDSLLDEVDEADEAIGGDTSPFLVTGELVCKSVITSRAD